MRLLNIFLCAFLLSSCDSYSKKLDGIDFSVGWINMPELTSLCYDYPKGESFGITEGRINDVYCNSKNIHSKQ